MPTNPEEEVTTSPEVETEPVEVEKETEDEGKPVGPATIVDANPEEQFPEHVAEL